MSSSMTWTLLSLLRASGHVVRMNEDTPPRRVFDAVVGGQRRQGLPLTRWKDQVEVDLNAEDLNMGGPRAKSRSAWREVLSRPKSDNRIVIAT